MAGEQLWSAGRGVGQGRLRAQGQPLHLQLSAGGRGAQRLPPQGHVAVFGLRGQRLPQDASSMALSQMCC